MQKSLRKRKTKIILKEEKEDKYWIRRAEKVLARNEPSISLEELKEKLKL